MLDLDSARKIIVNDKESFYNWSEAAGVICETQESTIDDLLLCLLREGLPSEIASVELHNRTGRPRGEAMPTLVLSIDDWKKYLGRT